ncbi:hypothetical protein RFI_12707, partial [Reticulomyxa filosa]
VNGIFEGKNQYYMQDHSLLIKGQWKEGKMSGEISEYEIETLDVTARPIRSRLDVLPATHERCQEQMDDWYKQHVFQMEKNLGANSDRLVGEWKKGSMVQARFVSSDNDGDANNAKEKKKKKSESEEKVAKEQWYCEDVSNEASIGGYPLLSDPYEVKCVYVAKSTLSDANEGLFALRKLFKDEVVSFYNGLRVRHKTVDERPWSENQYTNSVCSEFAVDSFVFFFSFLFFFGLFLSVGFVFDFEPQVPSEFAVMDKYCATMGHKANHDWDKQNARYDTFYHPRFGDIKCLRAICDIEPNEEIFVDYDYSDEWPEWFVDKYSH